MPLLKFNDLIDSQELHDIVKRLAASKPGLVLSTGTRGSGKLTTLLALADRLAQPGQQVVFVVEDEANIAPFRPLPDGWQERKVEPGVTGWQTALAENTIPGDAVVVVAPLHAGNTEAVMAIAPGRWLLATIESALLGLDAASDDPALGIGNERLVGAVRMMWSQQLADALCEQCSVPTELDATESAYLFPSGQVPQGIRIEVGCPQCDAASRQPRGTHGNVAVCGAVLIDDASRPAVRTALMDGLPLQLARTWQVTAPHYARSLLAAGAIGIGTYRALIRDNPLLRVQDAIER